MTIMRFLTTDSATGRLLTWGRGVLEILILLVTRPSRRSLRFASMILRVKPRFTMVNNANLIHLYETVESAAKEGLAGAIVECGVWNGGSAAVMALADREARGPSAAPRPVWLFDSFEGLPPPKEKDDRKALEHYFEGMNKGSIEAVKRVFTNLKLPLERLTITKGWFEQTLPKAELPATAILHIDADWYDSVKVVMETCYPKVVPGGYVILNDYGFWEGCDRAVEDYFAERKLAQPEIVRVGRVGGYFRKPA